LPLFASQKLPISPLNDDAEAIPIPVLQKEDVLI
jgi:hypothetical protein